MDPNSGIQTLSYINEGNLYRLIVIMKLCKGIKMDFPMIDDETLAALRNSPMPTYDGPEPDELTLARIQKYLDEDRFDELPVESQRWVTRRLMPSLVRYGCYPPPNES